MNLEKLSEWQFHACASVERLASARIELRVLFLIDPRPSTFYWKGRSASSTPFLYFVAPFLSEWESVTVLGEDVTPSEGRCSVC